MSTKDKSHDLKAFSLYLSSKIAIENSLKSMFFKKVKEIVKILSENGTLLKIKILRVITTLQSGLLT